MKIEASHADFPDSTTLSIADDESETSNSLVNPNDIMTSQAITFKDPETGAVYVQTQLLQVRLIMELCTNTVITGGLYYGIMYTLSYYRCALLWNYVHT